MSSAQPERAFAGVVPWWGVVSAAAAPVVLCGGWTTAAWLQPGRYDSVRQTVSALAAHGATDRWVMTLAFLAVGGCDVITGLALRPAARPGRIVLIAGGVGGMLVALSPETVGAGGSLPHAFFATIGFAALTIWPIAAAQTKPDAPWALRPAPAAAAAALTAALLGWFAVELISGGGQLGVAERALGELQALWPLIVVASCLMATHGGRRDRDASQSPAYRTRSEPQ